MPTIRSQSFQLVLLRFEVDVVQGAHVSKASLQVRSADASCQGGAQMTIWAEAADHSAPFDPTISEARPLTESAVQWDISGNTLD